MRVGIVSFEFEGVTRNGGIGTAYRLLAEALAASGAQVTVLLTHDKYADVDLKGAQAKMRPLGIEIVPVTTPERFLTNEWFVGQSMAVYEKLRASHFDVVHFPENIGNGYHSVLAKKLGLDFHDTTFVAGLHGSTSWIFDVIGERFPSGQQALMMELERKSVEMADVVVSPSAYMLRYVKERGWVLPPESMALANVNRVGLKPRKTTPCEMAKQLVFFGRLEERKGVSLFAEALLRYFEQGAPKLPTPLPVIFLGKDSTLKSGERASEYLRRTLEPLVPRIKLQFKPDLSSEAALEYLRSHPDSLVCMPSPVDNSPYVIVEALQEGLNFISSCRGGQGELIHPEDRKFALFEPNVEDLSRKIRSRLFWVAPRMRPSDELVQASERWVELHRAWCKKDKGPGRPRYPLSIPNSGEQPLVSVCINSSRYPDDLQEFVESLEFGVYPQVEILAAHSETERPPTGARVRAFALAPCKPWMKTLARAATGKYVLFLDRPRALQPYAISLLVDLAEKRGFERLCSAFSRVPWDGGVETTVPSPEHVLGGLFRYDPRIPLLFQSRKRFLAESKTFTTGRSVYSEQALWLLESSIAGRSFVCVPRALISLNHWRATEQEMEEYRASICELFASHIPPALGAVTPSLIHITNRMHAELQPKRQVRAGSMDAHGSNP